MRDLQNILSVCVLVCTCIGVRKHAYKQFYLCVPTHTSNRVCLCVQISLPVSVSRPNKPNRAQRSSFSIHCGQWSLQPQHSIGICKTALPQMQCFLHLIAVQYSRCVVPCLSHDRAKEMSRDEVLMWLFLSCDRDWHSVTRIITGLLFEQLASETFDICFFYDKFWFSLNFSWISINIGCQSAYAYWNIFQNVVILYLGFGGYCIMSMTLMF